MDKLYFLENVENLQNICENLFLLISLMFHFLLREELQDNEYHRSSNYATVNQFKKNTDKFLNHVSALNTQ